MVLGKADSGTKHDGLGQGSQRVIITAVVAAARAPQSMGGSSDRLPDLGSDPWSTSGEDDLKDKAKTVVTSKTEDANLCAIHTKHVTIQPKDIFLVKRIYTNVGAFKFFSILGPTH